MFVDRVSVSTPERVEVEHDIAGVGSRAVAQVIDWLVLFCAVLAGAALAALAGAAGAPGSLTLVVVIVALAVLPIAYFAVLEWRYGATPGKRVMRVRVVTEWGAPIGPREALTRNLLRIVDFLPSGYVLGGIVALASRRSQRLGDLAAGTIAVRVPRARARGQAGRASFAELAAAEREGDGVPAELLAVVAEYERRRKKLSEEARRSLAARIAVQLERHVVRPPGLTDDELIDAVHSGRPLR